MLYPDKNGRVSDLLEEARKQVELVDKENGKFRWVQFASGKHLPRGDWHRKCRMLTRFCRKGDSAAVLMNGVVPNLS